MTAERNTRVRSAPLKTFADGVRESLRVQLLASILICLLLSCGAFFLFQFAVQTNRTARAARVNPGIKATMLFQDFQARVTAQNIGSTDLTAISRWARKNTVAVFLGHSGDLWPKPGTIDIGAAPDGQAQAFQGVIRYRDGEASTLFVHQPLQTMPFVSWVVSLLLAFDVFLISSFLILKKKLDYVLRMEKGLTVLESGQLDHAIPVEGADELARLAEGINLLSRSVRDRMISEQRALQANRKIIGELSHDIRTPLTVGIGYLTLLLEKEDLDDRERREYLLLALKKAEQIGERARVLLDYATLASGQMTVRKSAVDARTLEKQLKDEISALAELHVEGGLPPGLNISGDIGLLERLFDNLLSNLRNHGDTSRPVAFRTALQGEQVLIEIKNAIDRRASQKKSSGSGSSLGLKICACILELHAGSFETMENGDTYNVKIRIPIRSAPASDI